MADALKVTDESIERGIALMDKNEDEIFNFLGYLGEEARTFEAWQGKKGILVPEWNEEEHWLEFVSGAERGVVKDCLTTGSKFFKEKVAPFVKDAVCENGHCREEIKELENDVKDLMKYLVGIIIGIINISLPAAAISISVAVAALLIKRGLRDFCK